MSPNDPPNSLQHPSNILVELVEHAEGFDVGTRVPEAEKR